MSDEEGEEMNKSVEQFFVKTYIDKDYQERLLFELNSMKKRSKALSRFSHDAETVLNKVLDKRIITDLSELHENDKAVYVISWDENDGMYIPFEDAMRYCENTSTSVILIGNSFSLIKEEVETGKPKIFYLKVRL